MALKVSIEDKTNKFVKSNEMKKRQCTGLKKDGKKCKKIKKVDSEEYYCKDHIYQEGKNYVYEQCFSATQKGTQCSRKGLCSDETDGVYYCAQHKKKQSEENKGKQNEKEQKEQEKKKIRKIVVKRVDDDYDARKNSVDYYDEDQKMDIDDDFVTSISENLEDSTYSVSDDEEYSEYLPSEESLESENESLESEKEKKEVELSKEKKLEKKKYKNNKVKTSIRCCGTNKNGTRCLRRGETEEVYYCKHHEKQLGVRNILRCDFVKDNGHHCRKTKEYKKGVNVYVCTIHTK